jgi:hypothetical protein
MNNLWVIVCGIGLQDSLNPCIFMTCAVFIACGFWLKKRSLPGGWPRIIFGLAYVSSFLEFNFGPAQIFLFHKNFIFAAKILYFVLGVLAFISGALFFKDWVLLHRKQSVKAQTDEKIKPFVGGQGLAVLLTTVILGVALSALATLSPINNYIMLLGNETILKGQWQTVMPLLLGYVFTSMWPLWLVWVFLSIKNLSPSLLKIVCSAIFFTASSCMILIFR